MNSKHYVGRIYTLKNYHRFYYREDPKNRPSFINKTAFNKSIAIIDETRKLIKTFTKNGKTCWISKFYLDKEIRDEIEDNPCKVLNGVIYNLIEISKEYPNLASRLQDTIRELKTVNIELEKAF